MITSLQHDSKQQPCWKRKAVHLTNRIACVSILLKEGHIAVQRILHQLPELIALHGKEVLFSMSFKCMYAYDMHEIWHTMQLLSASSVKHLTT